MKIKKGFTLVELLAVICILAIIVAITIPSYSKIMKRSQDKQYDNKLDFIKNVALKYADDTNNTSFFIDDLIINGYLDADNDSDVIDNRDGNTVMNCYLITIEEKNGQNYAQIDAKSYDINGKCDLNVLNNINKYAKIIIKNSDTNQDIIYNNETGSYWTNSNLKLELVLSDKAIEEDNNPNVEWYSGTKKIKEGRYLDNKEYFVSDIAYLQQNYTVKIKTNNKVHSFTIRVYIDKNKPTFYDKDASNTNLLNEKWEKSKVYNIQAYDNESGIKGYYLLDDVSKSCNDINKDLFLTTKKFKINKPGKYKGCIIDNAGNINESSIIDVKKIDNDSPKCGQLTGNSTSWLPKYNLSGQLNTRTISVECIDEGSGCKLDRYIKQYKETIKTDSVEICDNLNNCTMCDVDVYLDTDEPRCGKTTGEGSSSNWTNKNRNVSQECNDKGSGCLNNIFTKNFEESMKDGNIEIEDIAGNKTNCPVNVYIDKIAPFCTYNNMSLTQYNNTITTWLFNSVRNVVIGCSDDLSKCDSNYSKTIMADDAVIVSSGNSDVKNVSYVPLKIKDNAGNETLCDGNIMIKAEKPTPSTVGNTAINLDGENKISTFFTSGEAKSGIKENTITCKLLAVRNNTNNTTSWTDVSNEYMVSNSRKITIEKEDNKCIVHNLNNLGYSTKYDVKIQRCFKTIASGNQEVCSPIYSYYNIVYRPGENDPAPLCDKQPEGYYHSYYSIVSNNPNYPLVINDQKENMKCKKAIPNNKIYFSQSDNYDNN